MPLVHYHQIGVRFDFFSVKISTGWSLTNYGLTAVLFHPGLTLSPANVRSQENQTNWPNQRLLCLDLYRDPSPPQHLRSSCCIHRLHFTGVMKQWTQTQSQVMVHSVSQVSNSKPEDADHVSPSCCCCLHSPWHTFKTCAMFFFLCINVYKCTCVCVLYLPSFKKFKANYRLTNLWVFQRMLGICISQNRMLGSVNWM